MTTQRPIHLATPSVIVLFFALVGCASTESHRPQTRRDDDAVVWLVKDEFAKFHPSHWERPATKAADALAGKVPNSFPPADQAQESFEKLRRLGSPSERLPSGSKLP